VAPRGGGEKLGSEVGKYRKLSNKITLELHFLFFFKARKNWLKGANYFLGMQTIALVDW